MEYAVVVVAAAPLRKRPNHRREMVNQLLFGEMVHVLKERGRQWIKVSGLHDHYEGWLTRNLVQPIDEREALIACSNVTTGILNTVEIKSKILNIPFASSLPLMEAGEGKIGNSRYHYSGKFTDRFQQQPGLEVLQTLTHPWVNAPYMWGGRTVLGVDCSGFVQVIYKMMGFDLPRDAWQQAQEGKTIKKLRDASAGDLVFFDDKDEIVHTGILLGHEQIIHASGTVRVDPIDKKGIIHAEERRRTHRLELIKRVW